MNLAWVTYKLCPGEATDISPKQIFLVLSAHTRRRVCLLGAARSVSGQKAAMLGTRQDSGLLGRCGQLNS